MDIYIHFKRHCSSPTPTATTLMASKSRASLHLSLYSCPGKLSSAGQKARAWQWPTEITGVKVTQSNLHLLLLPTAASPKGSPVCVARDWPPLGRPVSVEWTTCVRGRGVRQGEGFISLTSLTPGPRTAPGPYCCINE